MNRYELTKEIEGNIMPLIKQYINNLKDFDNLDDELKEIDLTFMGVNPYQVCSMLKNLGWKQGEQQENGWQMDFWIPFTNNHSKYNLVLNGCGINFELILRTDLT